MKKKRQTRPRKRALGLREKAGDVYVARVNPRLRMIADGDTEVNTIRSQIVSSIAVAPMAARRARTRLVRDFHAAEGPKAPRLGRPVPPVHDIEASVFITQTSQLNRDDDPAPPSHKSIKESKLLREPRQRGRLISGKVRLSDLATLAKHPAVMSIELAEGLRAPDPRPAPKAVRTPRKKKLARRAAGGKDVIIGIIDVAGFDFAHEDFIDSKGKTRFHLIWDQGGSRRAPPDPFGYGSLIDHDRMQKAIDQESKTGGVSATAYEPQSQMQEGSHGTHVASIAAGNHGLCPHAKIAAVLVDLGDQLEDRRLSFYDSTRLADAVDFLIGVAEAEGLPISINVSLGTNGHAHDGSSAISRWIDSALTVPGRAVCVAAGNAGQEGPQSDDDLGYLSGRIHTSGRIPAKGLTTEIEWIVIGAGITDVSENELEIWYGAADRIGVSVKPPGEEWTTLIEPGQYIENRQVEGGSLFSVYNELYHPANGCNLIAIYLSPFLSNETIVGVKSGTWRIRLEGIEIRDGRFDGWIERDDPDHAGGGSYWSFPSVFSETSNVDKSSVSSLACGHNVVAVANLDEAANQINVSSSQGPTRDSRSKPEIAAPGTEITAACGFSSPDRRWISMTGTSMASPYVAGLIGLMLARRKDLTAAQILGIIQRTARPLPGNPYDWRNDAGYGAIDPEACLAEAETFSSRTEVKKP